MSANFEAKKAVVAEITEKIKASKSVVFVEYKGLTVAEVSALRNKCREAGCEYKVYKNTLVRKAFNELGYKDFDSDLNGPTAIAFGENETVAAKVMVNATKDYENKIMLKSGFVDNAYVDKAGVKSLATMPSKEELLAKLLGSLQGPVTGFAGVLSNIISSLPRALNAVAEKKA